MKIRTLDDGTLALDERLMVLRSGAVIGAMALVTVFAWTANTRGYLTGRELVGGTAGLLGLLGLAAAVADRSFRFERATGRLRWTVRRLFSTRSGEVPFHDVVRVSLRTSTDSDERHRIVHYQPMLVTRDGQMPLSSFYSSNAADSEALGRAISEALGRAVEPPREESLAELVASGRIVDAVKLVRREAAAKGGAPIGLTEAKAIVDGYRESEATERRAA